MERRSLYHSLRVNWQLDPTLEVKSWQVEDYRKLPPEQLFERLKGLGVPLDYSHFISLSESQDTPEDFAETLLPDEVEEQEVADQIYLIIFELWRRFLSEKQTLSLFCDEWDHQIDQFEEGTLMSAEGIDDAIGRFTTLLEDAVDQGEDPKMLYESVMQNCAHDLEAFLYDYTKIQIEEKNISYAEEIVDAFLPLAKDKCWFNLLHVEILSERDPDEAFDPIVQQIKECASLNDPEFNLEFLALLAIHSKDKRQFALLFKQIVTELAIEEDFWDLLSSCENFFHFNDVDNNEEWIKSLRIRRFKNDPEAKFSSSDPDLKVLQKLF